MKDNAVKIIVGSELGEAGAERLRKEFSDVEFMTGSNGDDQAATAKDADAYIGRINRQTVLAAGSRLRWVHSTGAGIETLAKIPELVDSDVVVTNTRGGHAPAIAEHTFAILLALTRRIPDLVEDQRRHVWKRAEVTGAMRELTGATMVVLGMGNIGSAIARRAVGFGMRIIGVDRNPPDPPEGIEAIWSVERLDDALRQADVLVVATPYTTETHHLVDARRVGLLPEGAIVIAISRGNIVDEAALVEALNTGRLGGVGLDVFATEPLAADSPLWDVPNLLVSPHCSGSSRQTRDRVWEITRENVRRFIKDEPLVNVCDTRAGF